MAKANSMHAKTTFWALRELLLDTAASDLDMDAST
jgi:hypothetical protein